MQTLTWNVIPNFAFRANVQMFVRSAEYRHGTLKKLAGDIFNRYLKGKEFDPALQAYVNLCYTIDVAKAEAIGRNAPTSRSNALMQAIAAIFACEAYMSDEHIAKLGTYIDSLRTMSGTPTWFYPKLETLRNFANYAKMADWLAGSLTIPPQLGKGMIDLIRESAAEAGQQVTHMMHELAMLRKYGVKSSFFQDGLMHQPSQAWVFVDFHEVHELMPEWGRFVSSYPVALVGLADRKSLTRIGVEPQERHVGESHILGVRTFFQAHVFMGLDPEGELDASFGLGLMPIRQFFERRNNGALYEYLRFAQAIRLYDLVVPLTTVAKMPQPILSKGPLERLKAALSRKKHPFNPDLLIPRLRTLENVGQLIRELEIEIEQADDETIERAKREIRRHEVVWHIRRLPQGKHPTPEARTRAEEYGIVLAENETFVRPHERGKGVLENAPHRAKVRLPNH